MSSRCRRRAFTLVELLVVIGIIALLISILLPSLSKARKSANTVKCLAQHKQLTSAMLIYAAQWKGALPWTNWGEGAAAGTPGPYAGWCYDGRARVAYPKFVEADLKLGVFWDILTTAKAWRCPDDSDPPKGNQQIQAVTTYIMNGCLSGATAWVDANSNPKVLFKVTSFRADTAVFWEIGSATDLPVGQTKDGASTPNEGITVRHAKGTTISFLDGHAEVWSLQRYMDELNKDGSPSGRGPSQLWRNPNSATGGRAALPATYTAHHSPFPSPTATDLVYSD